MNLIVRPYKKGDETKILELFETSFGSKLSLDYWNWRFVRNPFIEKDVDYIYLMWDGEKLVGHYAVSPIELLYEKQTIKSALSMTTMTHPEYGGKGIFSQLALELYHNLESNHNYSLIWGFPNNNSHYGFLKNLDWKDIAVQPFYKADLTKINFTEDIDKISLEKLSEKHIPLIKSKSDASISVNMNIAFCKWRLIENPVNDYYIVFEEESGNILIIKEFNIEDGKQFDIVYFNIQAPSNESMIRMLSTLRQSLGPGQLNIWFNYLNEDLILWEKCGFRLGNTNTYLSARNMKNLEINYCNWDIKMVYSDLY